jgi:hypothetical protein
MTYTKANTAKLQEIIRDGKAIVESLEASEKEAADILTDCCQILDVVRQEWGKENCWSSWDQSVRDAATEWLRRFYSMRGAFGNARR